MSDDNESDCLSSDSDEYQDVRSDMDRNNTPISFQGDSDISYGDNSVLQESDSDDASSLYCRYSDVDYRSDDYRPDNSPNSVLMSDDDDVEDDERSLSNSEGSNISVLNSDTSSSFDACTFDESDNNGSVVEENVYSNGNDFFDDNDSGDNNSDSSHDDYIEDGSFDASVDENDNNGSLIEENIVRSDDDDDTDNSVNNENNMDSSNCDIVEESDGFVNENDTDDDRNNSDIEENRDYVTDSESNYSFVNENDNDEIENSNDNTSNSNESYVYVSDEEVNASVNTINNGDSNSIISNDSSIHDHNSETRNNVVLSNNDIMSPESQNWLEYMIMSRIRQTTNIRYNIRNLVANHLTESLFSPSHMDSHIDTDEEFDFVDTPIVESERVVPDTRRTDAFRQRTWSLEECSICCEIILKEQNIKMLQCGHQFHGNCVAPWLVNNDTCPNCRKAA